MNTSVHESMRAGGAMDYEIHLGIVQKKYFAYGTPVPSGSSHMKASKSIDTLNGIHVKQQFHVRVEGDQSLPHHDLGICVEGAPEATMGTPGK